MNIILDTAQRVYGEYWTSNDTLDLTVPGEICSQVIGGAVVGSEDCLVLDIYIPQVSIYTNTHNISF